MSRILTFSRTYPSYHPKKDFHTYFVEKIHYNIWSTVPDKWMDAQSMIYDLNKHLPYNMVHDFVESLEMELDFNDKSKGHTIRAGHRWKAGDWFSPRVWSGKPYNSKMIQFAPDIQVKKVWDFDISGHDGKFFIEKSPFTILGVFVNEIANNDGLTPEDFKAWFKHPKPFEGQIICWNENINY
jgi:hypothetical protein